MEDYRGDGVFPRFIANWASWDTSVNLSSMGSIVMEVSGWNKWMNKRD